MNGRLVNWFYAFGHVGGSGSWVTPIPASVGVSNLGILTTMPSSYLREQGSSQAAAERQVALREPQLEFLPPSSHLAGSPGSRNSSYTGSYPHSEHGHDSSSSQLPSIGSSPLGHHNLIILSLTLPSALRRPTPFGQTLGTLRLLVLGAQGAGRILDGSVIGRQ